MIWKDTSIRMPESRQRVLVGFKNALGNWRCTVAMWVAEGDYEYDWTSYEDDEYYNEDRDLCILPQGWYEDTHGHEYMVQLEEVSYWMALPDIPGEEARDD